MATTFATIIPKLRRPHPLVRMRGMATTRAMRWGRVLGLSMVPTATRPLSTSTATTTASSSSSSMITPHHGDHPSDANARDPVAWSWRRSPLVDASRLTDPLVADGDLLVLPEVLTEDEELLVADECMRILRRRRYEENHWDQVIVKFKEMERSRWSPETRRILERIRHAPIIPQHLRYFPSVHVIDLEAEGYIKPHVDAIKFSGEVVAGVSLLSPSIMRFQEEHGDSRVEAKLLRRSLYMMTGRIRYHYTHEILPGLQLFRGEEPVHRTRRISIMFRDFHADDLAHLGDRSQ